MLNKTVFLSLALFISASATALPRAIEDQQQLFVNQGTCEKNWRDYAGDVNKLHYSLGSGLELWLVPCANWAINLETVAYLAITESTQPDGQLIRPLVFVDYDPYQGVFASPTLKNVQFDAANLKLQTREYFQSGSECGNQAQFHFDSGQQRFLLDQLLKNDDCRDNQGKWESPFANGLKPSTT